ncbi:EXS family-domain-containing protein [Naematelia encephala]|uniref:EXS family-domain-containing protein n=1 Tax=Naematelia encephala TaxID=71784 RepID=A0A1Y2B6A0_9TREE|nr:EXS family-domain-containing protein [Naematelia encephala]
MDIDSPPAPLADALPSSHAQFHLPTFSKTFPLPFRVLFLVGLAQLLWAVNLHVLHLLNLDTAWILDIRDDNPDPPGLELDTLGIPEDNVVQLDTPGRQRTMAAPKSLRVDSGSLYGPIYKLFLVYTAWVGGGWFLFRWLTDGDGELMERYRALVAVIGIGVGVGAVTPWHGPGERERASLRRAIKRIVMPPLRDPIFFSDVILADILTSFAKVLGDMWISMCQIWSGNITQGRVAQDGVAGYITLFMVCLPYLLRFRQCLLEYHQSGYSSPRPLANALKYFSAFPVIALSAAQKVLLTDIAVSRGLTMQQLNEQEGRWYGEHRLFRLWILGVVINSLYSFWWDVEMDWGLALCEVDTWLGPSRRVDSGGGGGLLGSPGGSTRGHTGRSDWSIWGRARRLFRRSSVSHQRSPCPTPSPAFAPPLPAEIPSTANRFFAFGLRPILLLPDPLVYHLFTLIDLVLRFTWSLKLSSHLHTISEIESGVFMMEALELMRRWMWVFIRIEWEAVKMGEIRRFGANRDRGQEVWDAAKEPDG